MPLDKKMTKIMKAQVVQAMLTSDFTPLRVKEALQKHLDEFREREAEAVRKRLVGSL
jgi:hypothetical protein